MERIYFWIGAVVFWLVSSGAFVLISFVIFDNIMLSVKRWLNNRKLKKAIGKSLTDNVLDPYQIAHKYVHGLHDALTDNQEKKRHDRRYK